MWKMTKESFEVLMDKTDDAQDWLQNNGGGTWGDKQSNP